MSVHDHNVSAKLEKLRLSHGGDPDRCPTCGKNPATPYRRIVGGKITEGCIDASHTGRLPPTSSTATWHDRPVAARFRKTALQRLLDLGKGIRLRR